MVEGPLFDSHCHLFLMEEDAAAVMEASRSAGLVGLVCVGIDAESSQRSRELADALPGVFATAGLHPHDAQAFDAVAGAAIEELAQDARVVAVGETGLDHYRMLSPPEEQERAFRAHCGLARETGKPLVVHVRDAWPDVLRILEDESAERVILHCFSGDVDTAREAAARGYHCSFAGNVTYPKNVSLRGAAAAVPGHLLLVETDSPFLAPQPVRGSPNTPANVAAVVAAVAEARGESLAAVASRTARNAKTAFALPE